MLCVEKKKRLMYAYVERRRGGLWLMGKLPSAAVRGVCCREEGLNVRAVRGEEEGRGCAWDAALREGEGLKL